MPRYHFNVYDGVTVIDRDGMQLADAEAARTEGARLAGELLRNDAGKRVLGEDWRVEVTDGRGMIFFRIDILMHDAPSMRAFSASERH